MNPCRITEDLIPLYVDNACSSGSREYVEEHVKSCPACRALLDSMKEAAEPALPHQNPQKSFRRFSLSLVRRRVLAITLCVLLGVGFISLISFNPVTIWLSENLHIPAEDINAQISLLSDGTLYAELSYTGKEYKVAGSSMKISRDGVCTLSLTHTRLHDLLLESDDTKYTRYIQTEESDYIKRHSSDGKAPLDAVRVVLTDGKTEIVLWEKGQNPPPADETIEVQFMQTVTDSDTYQKREEDT